MLNYEVNKAVIHASLIQFATVTIKKALFFYGFANEIKLHRMLGNYIITGKRFLNPHKMCLIAFIEVI